VVTVLTTARVPGLARFRWESARRAEVLDAASS